MDWIKRLLLFGAFLAGFILIGGHAWADSGSANASGDTVGVQAANGSPTVQADVCGNAVGVIGSPQASCGGDQGTSPSGGGGTVQGGGSGGDGNLSGDTVGVQAANGSPTVQADVCGNAVGVIGSPQASCGGDQGTSPSGGGGTVQGGGSGGDGGGGGNPPAGDSGGNPPAGDSGGNPPAGDSGGNPPPSGGNPPPGEGGGNPVTGEGGGNPVTGTAPEVTTAALGTQALASPATQAFTGDHLLAFMLLAVVMLLLGTLLWAWGTLKVDRA
jgi:hypothetical protein